VDKKKTHMENTAADSILVAFDYQYYFFLWKLLSLRTGESVGLEVKDDVHTELNNNEQILYQVKHTVKTKSNGKPINVTESDIDLWKTLSNWSKIISDKNDDRSLEHLQLQFLKKTTFVLASNKSNAKNNRILNGIVNFQKDTVEIKELQELFKNFLSKSNDDKLKEFIEDVLNLKTPVFSKFAKKIAFELGEDDILKKCKDAIKADKIESHKVDDVFSKIDSAVRANNFINIKNGCKIQISFDDYYLKYRRFYDLARNEVLQIQEFTGTLPNNLESQIFIQQLIEIGDIDEENLEEISAFTIFKLKLQNNINIWLLNGEITDNEIESFKKDAIDQWHNKHRATFRHITEESDYNNTGLNILDSMRGKKLTIAEQLLDTDISNGTFYDLSDIPQIGWRKDWKKYQDD
jgi:hypothetical protein